MNREGASRITTIMLDGAAVDKAVRPPDEMFRILGEEPLGGARKPPAS